MKFQEYPKAKGKARKVRKSERSKVFENNKQLGKKTNKNAK